MNQKKESCRRCDELSAEIQQLRTENKQLRYMVELYEQLQDFAPYGRLPKDKKSGECLVVAFRSNRN